MSKCTLNARTDKKQKRFLVEQRASIQTDRRVSSNETELGWKEKLIHSSAASKLYTELYKADNDVCSAQS